MGCLFLIFGAAFPRLATIFIWLARPAFFSMAFGGAWLIPLLGIIFLPFTTLMYVLLWSPAGLIGWDWVWLFLAVVIDLGGLAGSSYANRDRIPAGYPGSMPPA